MAINNEIEKNKKLLASKYMEEALLLVNEFILEASKRKPEIIKLKILAQKAIGKGKKAEELDPNNPEILFQIGNIYLILSGMSEVNFEEAIRYYKKAVELDPNNPLYQEKLNEIEGVKIFPPLY